MSTMRAKLFGETYEITWTGSVWRRDDNGEQSAHADRLLRGMIEDSIRAGGDDPADYADEISDAIASAA